LVGVYGLNELFTASQQFCGGLTACVFFVVFWLAIKISGSFTAISAKLGLAVIDCGLRVYTQITRCVCNMCSSRPHLALCALDCDREKEKSGLKAKLSDQNSHHHRHHHLFV